MLGYGLQAWRFAIVLAAFALLPVGCAPKAPPEAAPIAVDVAKVARRSVPLTAQYVAQTQAMQQVELVPRVEGILEHVYFQNGSLVEKGQLLMQIQPDQYEAQVMAAQGSFDKATADLARARSNVSDQKAKAELAQALAAFHYQRLQVARMRPLAHASAVSQQDYDQTKAQFEAAAANVFAARANLADVELNQRTSILNAQASLEQATAQLTNAKLELSYTKILSPVTGIISFLNVDEGNLVDPLKTTKLATVSTIDPIKVVFQLSESDYLKVAPDLARLRETGDRPSVDFVLSSGQPYRYTGHAVAINRAVDASTGTIAVEAMFPNPSGFLRPGQFGRARFTIGRVENALVIPRSALQTLQDTPIVYVVGPGNTLQLRTVDTGSDSGNDIVITRGLRAGELVVVSPGSRVQAGTVVRPHVTPAV